MSDHSTHSPKRLEEQVWYRLILFVAGKEPNSILARHNLETFCNAEFKDRYELQIVDVFQDHRLALEYRVLVTPCLIMLEPEPSVMIAGTLQNTDKVRNALRLEIKDSL